MLLDLDWYEMDVDYAVRELIRDMKGSDDPQTLRDLAFVSYLGGAFAAVQPLPWYRSYKKRSRKHHQEWAIRFAAVGLRRRAFDEAIKGGVAWDEIRSVAALLFDETF